MTQISQLHPMSPKPAAMQAMTDTSGTESGLVADQLLPRGDGPREQQRPVHLYSGFVQAMKVILPILAVGLIGLVMAWPHMRTDDLKFRIGFAALQANLSDEPNLLNPRYHGTDDDNQPYTITADIAKRLGGGDENARVGLEMPKADITLEDGTWLVLTAETGLYERGQKSLELQGAVNLFHDSGYEFRTDEAQIDLNAGIATGTVPVQGQGPFGTLNSEQGFQLLDKGRRIVFMGKSHLTLLPQADMVAR